MKKEFSLEEKLEAISLVFQGESARSVSDRLHLGHHLLYEWLEAYKSKGTLGLKPKRKGRNRLRYEEKCRIVREYQENDLTLFRLSVKYNISSSLLSNWVRLVEEGGFEALLPKKRGPRLPKEEYEKENERLRKENERLRLENLLLKKVRAIVEEREARNRAIGRKPSKN